jgi:hypothetical protein
VSADGRHPVHGHLVTHCRRQESGQKSDPASDDSREDEGGDPSGYPDLSTVTWSQHSRSLRHTYPGKITVTWSHKPIVTYNLPIIAGGYLWITRGVPWGAVCPPDPPRILKLRNFLCGWVRQEGKIARERGAEAPTEATGHVLAVQMTLSQTKGRKPFLKAPGPSHLALHVLGEAGGIGNAVGVAEKWCWAIRQPSGRRVWSRLGKEQAAERRAFLEREKRQTTRPNAAPNGKPQHPAKRDFDRAGQLAVAKQSPEPEDRAAQWAMLEELGQKSREQGLSPGLHRSRELRRE